MTLVIFEGSHLDFFPTYITTNCLSCCQLQNVITEMKLKHSEQEPLILTNSAPCDFVNYELMLR
jgi:hypothetical protein